MGQRKLNKRRAKNAATSWDLEENQSVTRTDADVMDLVTQVQLNVKLPVQLESRMRDMEEATYCTLFLPKESDVREMQDASRVFSELVTK